MAFFIDPFDILLNEISHDLNHDNLRSLIQVCGYYIPERVRENINHGLELFTILRQRDVVSSDREKICNLLEILKAVRPKRKDLVRKVKRYIKEHYVDPPDKVLIIDYTGEFDLEASTSSEDGGLRLNPTPSDQYGDGNSTATTTSPSTSSSFARGPRAHPMDCCCCCCCGCNCYSIQVPPCLWGSLSAVMALLTLVAVLAWHADLPRVTPFLTGDDELNRSGKYVIGVLVSITLVFLLLAIKAKLNRRRQIAYAVTMPHYGSINPVMDSSEVVSSQDSARTLPRQGSVAREIDKRRRISQSTSGCSSRISSHLSQASMLVSPPSIQSRATAGRICEHCAGDCVSFGHPPSHKMSQPTSDCLSRISSQPSMLNSPPSIQSRATAGRTCEHCTGDCVSFRHPPSHRMSQPTSGCISRISSQPSVPTPPPSIQSQIAIGRICEHCGAGGGSVSCGHLPVSRASSGYNQGDCKHGQMPVMVNRLKMHTEAPSCEAKPVNGTGACQGWQELDHNVEQDGMVCQTLEQENVVDCGSLGHSDSSGIFFSAVEEGE